MSIKKIAKQVRKLSSIFWATIIVLNIASIASAANVPIGFPDLDYDFSL